jgi:hypothetical protein
MAEFADRIAPHDELVRRSFDAGFAGGHMPDFGYMSGFTQWQREAINAAYEAGRCNLAAQGARSMRRG